LNSYAAADISCEMVSLPIKSRVGGVEPLQIDHPPRRVRRRRRLSRRTVRREAI
jgi:hypothetical protein